MVNKQKMLNLVSNKEIQIRYKILLPKSDTRYPAHWPWLEIKKLNTQ